MTRTLFRIRDISDTTINNLLLVLVATTAGFILFHGLGYPSVRMWDESRLAVNAVEMLDNGQFFVTYFDGSPDMWNTKPPLMIWAISLCMSLFGATPFALRLPSAIAAATTVCLVLLFSIFYLKSLWVGILSALVLVTSLGFVGEHVARTGDYDALLVFWTTLCSLSFFAYLNSLKPGKSPNKYLWVSTLAFILAVWTKGIAGALILPGLILYLATQPKLIGKVCRTQHIYYAVLLCITFSLLPYLVREYLNPGYIKAVLDNEVLGRYSDSIENHTGPINFYLQGLRYRYSPWLYLWLPCLVVSALSSKKEFRVYGKFCFFYTSFFLMVISLAGTKLPWYDAPLYPISSIMLGAGIQQIIENLYGNHYSQKILNLLPGKKLRLSAIFVFVFLLISVNSLYFACNHAIKNHGILYEWSFLERPELQYGDYFAEIIKLYPSIREASIPLKSDEYNAHLLFYSKVYARKGFSFSVEEYGITPHQHNFIVTCDKDVYSELLSSGKFKTVHQNNYCGTLLDITDNSNSG